MCPGYLDVLGTRVRRLDLGASPSQSGFLQHEIGQLASTRAVSSHFSSLPSAFSMKENLFGRENAVRGSVHGLARR